MDLFTAERNAKLLMAAHGLVGWRFEWDNAARRFGRCTYSTRTISMSRQLTVQRTEMAVRNTMLHEIAHALVGPGHGHDAVWRAKAISIGCDGKRCSADKVEVNYKYVAKCPNGHISRKYLRKPRASARGRSCPICSPVYNAKYAIRVVAI
ncbi:SprT-like protease [Streptomyces phage Blueeyedbeauty]|uniref:SprT-like protease n=1 Tax=Streptomyces phage Blueeyedbeauty TaxID=2250336 RepID=A0A345L240_9CAUD|nr:SprT-like protease [Streptomyces phage Blueeyedbeauty]AXH49342.1 SprT-like protease [Streptomyces phage Blueeyedbeauty]